MQKRQDALLAIPLAMTLALAGCGGGVETNATTETTQEAGSAAARGGSFTDEVDEKTGAISIKADHAANGAALGAIGETVVVREGEAVSVETVMESGRFSVMLLDADGNTALKTTLDTRSKDALLTVEPGTYSFGATVEEDNTTGKATVKTVEDTSGRQDEQRDTTTDDLAEAVQKSGLDGMTLPAPQRLSIGDLSFDGYEWSDKRVTAKGKVADARITIVKCDDEQDNPFENRAFLYNWEQVTDDISVGCHGDNENQTIRAVWKRDGVTYGLQTEGTGGAADVGLTEEDVAKIVRETT